MPVKTGEVHWGPQKVLLLLHGSSSGSHSIWMSFVALQSQPYYVLGGSVLCSAHAAQARTVLGMLYLLPGTHA